MTIYEETEQEPADPITWLSVEYREQIAELAEHYPHEQQALHVEWPDLMQTKWLDEYGYELVGDADEIMQHLEDALPQTDMPVDVSGLSGAKVRIIGAPDYAVRPVDAAHTFGVGEFAAVAGQVSKVTEIFEEGTVIAYECQRCEVVQEIPQPHPEERQEPHQCAGCERQGPFRIDLQSTELGPLQKARLEQPPEETQGASGAHLDAWLRDDLVGSITAGDRITMCGTKQLREQGPDSSLFASYIDATSTEAEEEDYTEIDVSAHRDRIEELAAQDDALEQVVQSLAPKIQGHEMIKQAIALQLFGGVRTQRPDGSVERGDVHVLLLGDPGTAKSTLLDFVSELSPRSVKISGKGASAAGVTAAAVRDDWGGSEWTLEAGALVLANKGVACIDEIDKIDENVRSSMHRAMANQEVNISKAGITATLPTRTSVLAAGNPKYGRFDETEPIAEQIDLGPTLLSRFDLQFMITDVPDADGDQELAKTIVQGRQAAADVVHHGQEAADAVEPAIEPEVIRAWIAHARRTCQPRITDDAVMDALSESFATLRAMNGEGPGTTVPVTFRKLEGIQRLAEASARLRLSQEVEAEDVQRAQALVGYSMQQLGTDDDGQLDADIVEVGSPKTQR
jgi:replicative DNA helicase Mcm